jgi:hypothetical protein
MAIRAQQAAFVRLNEDEFPLEIRERAHVELEALLNLPCRPRSGIEQMTQTTAVA